MAIVVRIFSGGPGPLRKDGRVESLPRSMKGLFWAAMSPTFIFSRSRAGISVQQGVPSGERGYFLGSSAGIVRQAQ